ncbi:hypothetical protein EDC30_1235 [Paucimonas lemoignei]|uniref:Uncharacterized protein n=1 Tax=Paucimonas lemoignei TaxID=29443 RepID=A0A4R3HNZ3_PAULE|nr:hypothetical protein EDC30_1235 [Paucimonas lemoignei]
MNQLTDLLLPSVVGIIVMLVLRCHVVRSRAAAREIRRSVVMSTEPYGRELAEAVANRLERGDILAYGHRDYCGIGLRYADGEYIYGEVSDGELPSRAQLSKWTDVPAQMERRVFSSRNLFVSWLADQSDESLHGRELQDKWLVGNQRLSKRRLDSFAKGHRVPHAE